MSGRELKMVWQFMPHAGETRAAQALLVTKGKVQAPRVPAYIVDGLVYKKRGKQGHHSIMLLTTSHPGTAVCRT